MKLKKYFESQGTIFTTTTPDTPQHNRIAERTNRNLLDRTRSMLHHAKLPRSYWQDALDTAVYITNRCVPSSFKDKHMTRYEAWTGQKPSVSHLRVFGCDAYYRQQIITQISTMYIHIRYDSNTVGYYYVYDPALQKEIRTRDVTFDERSFSFGKRNDAGNNRNTHTTETSPQQSIQQQQQQNIYDLSDIIYVPIAAQPQTDKQMQPNNNHVAQTSTTQNNNHAVHNTNHYHTILKLNMTWTTWITRKINLVIPKPLHNSFQAYYLPYQKKP